MNKKDLFFGCYLRELPHFKDGRGSLTPLFQGEEEKLVMAYTSTTLRGEARDGHQWHIHRYQTDRFACLWGMVEFALSDGFETRKVTLNPNQPWMLYIPPDVYHCFQQVGLQPAVIINFPTVDFDPEDEGRVLFTELEAPRPW